MAFRGFSHGSLTPSPPIPSVFDPLYPMDPKYFDALPADIRSLIDQIEGVSRTEIAVTPDPKRIDTLGCHIECGGAEILIPPNEYFPPGAVLHELLHIKRIYLDGVPRIVFCNDCNDYEDDLPKEMRLRSGLVAVDNNLEHLVIVAKEIELRPDRKSHWEQSMGQKLVDLRSDTIPADIRRGRVVEYWPFIHHVLPDSVLVAQIRALAEQLKVLEPANAFFQAIVPVLDSKEAAVRVWMKYFPGQEKIVCLKYFDIQNRNCREVHVPAANG